MQSKPENNSSPAVEPAPRHLYEYAVIRFLPRVERDEFVNVGLVMMCKRRRWVKARIHLDEDLIARFAPGWDITTLRSQLQSFEQIAAGKGESPIASIEAHERFRWLTAVRSACIATARPHCGHAADLDSTFDSLFSQLVDRSSMND